MPIPHPHFPISPSVYFLHISLVLLIHLFIYFYHPTPALRLSKMKHPIWGPICWMIFSHCKHVHKPAFYAEALSTSSWPICSLFFPSHFSVCVPSLYPSFFHYHISFSCLGLSQGCFLGNVQYHVGTIFFPHCLQNSFWKLEFFPCSPKATAVAMSPAEHVLLSVVW